MKKPLSIIGRAEHVDFPQLLAVRVPAKIDTGADASSIWAHDVSKDEKGNLHVVFFGPGSDHYQEIVHIFKPSEYTITRVANSFGHREVRYKVKLKIKVRRRLINGTFTLSDRSTKLYPILLGRSLIKHKFLVDVTRGTPLVEEEKRRAVNLKEELIKLTEGDE